IDKNFKTVSQPFKEKAPLWVWLGGAFGACYVSINILLVGIIGTGPTVVLVLFGQITGSILVQQFGLFRSQKSSTAPIQVLGLLIMLVGVIIVNLIKKELYELSTRPSPYLNDDKCCRRK